METGLIEAARVAIDSGQVTQDGRPLVSALETALGRDVTADERDEAYRAVLAGDPALNSNPSDFPIRKLDRLESEARPAPVQDAARMAARWIYTGPNTRANGVPVLRHTVFVGGLPAYLAGLENKCKLLGGKK